MLKLGELVAFLRADDSDLERGLDRGERRFDRYGAHVNDVVEHAAVVAGAAGERGGANFADGLWRDNNGRLHDALGRFVAESTLAGAQAGSQAGGGLAGGIEKAVSKLASGGPLMLLVKIILALAAATLFAAPAVYILGGALGAIPALATGAGFAVGALIIGFLGLGDAFKKTASSGGSVVDRAYQIMVAQRNVALATREAAEASEAINRAREDEIERLDDLARAQARASLDQKAATRAVEDAEKALQRAKRGGNRTKVDIAQEDLDKAKLDLADVQDRVDDLGKERAKANEDGIDGSDQVEAAMRRQEQATYALVDANHALQQAQRPPAGGGAAAEMTKLSASAMATVAVIKSFKDEWEDLRLSTQEHLFKGTASEISASAKAWFQPAKEELARYADTWNAIFKTGAQSSRTPEFIAQTMVGLESVRGLLDRVGKAIAGPGVRAWGQLSKAAAPFIDMLGTKLEGMVVNFSNWIDKAEKSGALTSFFQKSAWYLGEIWDIGGEVTKIIGQLFAIWSGSNGQRASDNALDDIKTTLQDLDTWLADPEHREQVKQFMDDISSSFAIGVKVFEWLRDTGIPVAGEWIDRVDGWIDTVEGWIDKASNWRDEVRTTVDDVAGALGGLPQRVDNAVAGLFNPLKNDFKSVINFVIDGWNRLSFAIPGIDIPGIGRWGGGTFGVTRIPRLSAGGTMLQAGLAHIAEHGTEGITLPLPAGAQVQPLAPGWRNQGQGGGGISGWIEIRGTGLLAGLRETVAIDGGRVEAVVGA